MPTDLGPIDLTDYTSHSPFVPSASSEANAGFLAWKAFTGTAADGWAGNTATEWLKIDLGSAQLLGSYSIQKIPTQGYILTDWTMEGSNDNSTWDVLDTRSLEIGWGTSETRVYTCAVHTTAYRYFRLNITGNAGGYTMVGELRLYSETAPSGAIAPEGGPVVLISPVDLTSNTSHSPFVTSASSEYNPAYGAFRGLVSGGSWLGFGLSNLWLKIDLGTAKVLGRYTITNNGTRSPGAWTMEGSNDNSTWDVLDTRAGVVSGDGGAGPDTKMYRCAVVTSAYRYFRIHITAEQGSEDIGEIYALRLYQGYAGLADQTITFPTISSHASTDAPFALAATSDSGLAVSYAVTSGPATVSGNTVTLTGSTGSVTIEATQAGDGSFNAATPVSRTFAVTGLTAQTITFPAISSGAANDPPFVLVGTASSGLAVSYSVLSGNATISGNVVTITGVGDVTIRASQAGDGTYAAATPVDRTFTVAPAQRGCIAFDQIKASDRTGNGNQLLTYSPAPTAATSPGTPGQVAFDAAGYWYFCYGVNQWGRIGPTGYGSAAASPPSW